MCFLPLLLCGVVFYCFLRRGGCVVSDALRSTIDALVGAAPSLSSAADSVGTITAGSDVVVSNFAGVEAVLDRLADFFNELKDGSWYAPVGLVSPFAGVSAPVGWCLCDGRDLTDPAVSVELNALLVAAGFGVVPDLRGRVVAGIDNMGGTDAARLSLANTPGAAGGAEGLSEHSHSISGSGTTSGQSNDHSHYFNDTYTAFSSAGPQLAAGATHSRFTFGYADQGDNTAGVSGDHSHTWSFSGNSGPTGTGGHGVVQPTIVLNYIIKA